MGLTITMASGSSKGCLYQAGPHYSHVSSSASLPSAQTVLLFFLSHFSITHLLMVVAPVVPLSAMTSSFER